MAGNLTNNQKRVLDLADCLLAPPGIINGAYLEKCVQSAAMLGRPNEYAEMTLNKLMNGLGTVELGPSKMMSVVMMVRNDISAAISDLNSFITSRAKNAGYAPTVNPFSRIVSLNIDRDHTIPATIDAVDADEIIDEIISVLDMYTGEKNVSQSDPSVNDNPAIQEALKEAAQISSYTLSFNGFKTATNPTNELMSLSPDSDEVKQRKVAESLAVFDFGRRVPKVLFTTRYCPDGKPRGIIVGWRKMSDASGYIVTKREVFYNKSKVMKFDNTKIMAEYEHVKEYVSNWVLSFYGNIDDDSVYAFLDEDVEDDRFYVYDVQAYQMKHSGKEFVFNVDTRPAALPYVALAEIKKELEDSAATIKTGLRLTADDISPYPALAKKIYGDSKFDWILAAVNTKAAQSRGLFTDYARSYAYLGARFSFIESEINSGKFVVPVNVDKVIDNVTKSLSTFGISQTIIEILQKTGLIFFFVGEETGDDVIVRALASDDETNMLTNILSAIDSETATIDLKVLASNLSKSKSITKTSSKISNVNARASEIAMPSASAPAAASISAATAAAAKSSGQNELTTLLADIAKDDELVDLTTFEGIGRFVRAIRIFFDFRPDRDSF